MKYSRLPLVLLAALTASAPVFAGPFHIDSGATGTATIQVAGGCKVGPYKFDAKFGEVLDSANNSVGSGIVSASGLLLATMQASSSSSPSADTALNADSATSHTDIVMFLNLAGPELYDYIQFQSKTACVIGTAFPLGSSKMVIHADPSKASYMINAGFAGYTLTPDAGTCVVNGTKTNCKAKKFTGHITFKGTAP